MYGYPRSQYLWSTWRAHYAQQHRYLSSISRLDCLWPIRCSVSKLPSDYSLFVVMIALTYHSLVNSIGTFIQRSPRRLWRWYITSRTCEGASITTLSRALYATDTNYCSRAILEVSAEGELHSTLQATISYGHRWTREVLEIATAGLAKAVIRFTGGLADRHSFRVNRDIFRIFCAYQVKFVLCCLFANFGGH